MAAETSRVEGFGHVSRTTGVVFRYLLLVATLVGILALGILLVYVGIDAFQPFTADPGWHLTFLATLVVPTLAVLLYLRYRTERGVGVGLAALGIPIVGALFGAGVSIVFVDLVPTLVWLAYVVAVVIPIGVVYVVDRLVGLPSLVEVVGGVVLLAASVLVVPGVVLFLPYIPTRGITLAYTLGGPIALLVGWFVADRWRSRRAGYVAGGAVFLLTVAAAFVGRFVVGGPIPAVILTLSSVVPAAVYVAVVLAGSDFVSPGGWVRAAVMGDRASTASPAEPVVRSLGDERGLLLPLVVVVGVVLGVVATDLLGFAGPQSIVDWQFLTSTTVTDPETAGIYPALVGSILLMIVVVLAAFPVGVGAAIYLEEYASGGRLTQLVQVNISNLAGVPSVVYGLLGLGVFIRYAGAPPGTVIVGGLTLALLILPIVIIAAQEALRSVPDSTREASYGMGATRWQTIRNVVLPRAFPGILTGTILAIGRAVGETAPLLVIGAANVADMPTDLTSRVAALPLQIYVWATTFAQPAFLDRIIPATVIVLLVILLTMNSVAIVLRNRYQTEG